MTNQIGMTQEPDILFVTCVCAKSNSSVQHLLNVQNGKLRKKDNLILLEN